MIATIILLGASFSAFPQTGIGKSYGTRDPRKDCGDLKGAAPTEAIAMKSFICHAEQETYPHIWLVEDVSVQVGAGRPYNMKEDYNVPEIDVRAKVYPIRGSFKNYQCDPLSNILHNQGKNCLMSNQPKASGLCYKNTWGEWLCTMSGSELAVVSPPPGEGAATADDTQTTTKNNNSAPKPNQNNDEKIADNPANENIDDNLGSDIAGNWVGRSFDNTKKVEFNFGKIWNDNGDRHGVATTKIDGVRAGEEIFRVIDNKTIELETQKGVRYRVNVEVTKDGGQLLMTSNGATIKFQRQ